LVLLLLLLLESKKGIASLVISCASVQGRQCVVCLCKSCEGVRMLVIAVSMVMVVAMLVLVLVVGVAMMSTMRTALRPDGCRSSPSGNHNRRPMDQMHLRSLVLLYCRV
jgi:hypothetical protein